MAQAITHHGFHDHHEAGRPDPTRIGALGATMALNLGALLVLAMPMQTDIAPQALVPPSRPPTVDIVARRDPPPPPPVPTRPQPERPARANTNPAPVAQPPVVIVQGPGPVAPVVPDPFAGPAPVASATGGAGTAAATGMVTLRYTQAPAPRYPRPALRAGLTGTVWLRVLVDEQGLPVTVEVDEGSGHRVLDDAARRQVLSHWRFQPAVADGRPVQAWGRVPIEFKLDR